MGGGVLLSSGELADNTWVGGQGRLGVAKGIRLRRNELALVVRAGKINYKRDEKIELRRLTCYRSDYLNFRD